MSELLLLLTALIFYTLGRYAGHERDIVHQAKALKKKLHPSKGMIISAPTAEEIVYNESYERRVDEARERVFQEQFKP